MLTAVVAVSGWISSASRVVSMTWGPVTGMFGEELYGDHRFRWLDSPAEIAVWAPTAIAVALEGNWRCGFNAPETSLELIVNGQPLNKVQLGQQMQRITWPAVPLKSGQNILRFVSSAGHGSIGARDPRVVAVGVEDLQVHYREAILHSGDGWFFLGAAALLLIGWRLATGLGLRQIDAIGAALLAAFASISVSATLLSAGHNLTGITWITALVTISAGLLWTKRAASAPKIGTGLNSWHFCLLLLPAMAVGMVQIWSPVTKYDDLMYHGSRAGYWLENHSVFPFNTHNERQEVFPYPGDLLFAFGVFTAHSEAWGKMVVFLAYPFLLLMTAGLLLKRGVSRPLAIGTAWAVGVAPQVREAAIGIKPDLWGLVFTLVAINATWNIWYDSQARSRRINGVIGLGAICAAVAVKATFLLLLPLAFIPLIFAESFNERVKLLLAAVGWAVAFGLVITFTHNQRVEGGWLGSPAMMAIHRPDPGVGALQRHLVRLPFLIFGLPWMPNEPMRQSLEEKLTYLANQLGATKALPLESNAGWPGIFSVSLPQFNRGYSLLWLIGMAGIVAGIANFRRLRTDHDAGAAAAVLLLGVILTVGVSYSVRWQSNSDIPERFLIPGLTILTVGAAWCWDRSGFRHPAIQIVLAMTLLVHAIPFIHDNWVFFLQVRDGGAATNRAESVLSPAAALIPPDSRVLLFASQSSGDYVMFHPELGFPTKVISWGRSPFSEKAFASMLTQANPDFIVFEQAGTVNFHWHGSLPLAPFIHSLEASGQFHLIPAGTPNLIYQRHGISP